MRLNHMQVAVVAMVGVNIIWGAAFPITKPALASIPPFTFALLRFALALLVLLALAGREALALLRGPDRRRLWTMGALGFCAAQLAQTVALRLSPASDISILSAVTPLLIVLLAWPWLGERPRRAQWAGLAGATIGLALVLWPSGADPGGGALRLLGDAIFIAGMLGWAAYNVLGRGLMARVSPLPATAAAALTGTVALLPFAIGELALGAPVGISLAGVVGVVYTGLLVTVLGFLTLFWAYRRVDAATIAATMYIQPLVGVLLSWALLGESLGGLFVAGAALVLAGVWLTSKQPGSLSTDRHS